MPRTITFAENDFHTWADSVGHSDYRSKTSCWERVPSVKINELKYWRVAKRYLPAGIVKIHALRTRHGPYWYTFDVTFASEAAATLVALGRG